MSEPFLYFKYREINNYSLDSLVRGTLYFAAPEELNDPFDCKLDIEKSILHAKTKLNSEQKRNLDRLLNYKKSHEVMQKSIGKIGVCSFSLDTKNVLMWSHYSNNHKGMTILYRFPEEYLNDEDYFLGNSEVKYENDPLTKWFINNAVKSEINSREYLFKLAIIILTSKNPKWYYEKEARIIRKESGIFSIKKEFIIQICFGLNTSQEDIELIREIVSHYNHKVTLCRVIRTESDFGIDIQEM